jgi:hypothetical protein
MSTGSHSDDVLVAADAAFSSYQQARRAAVTTFNAAMRTAARAKREHTRALDAADLLLYDVWAINNQQFQAAMGCSFKKWFRSKPGVTKQAYGTALKVFKQEAVNRDVTARGYHGRRLPQAPTSVRGQPLCVPALECREGGDPTALPLGR